MSHLGRSVGVTEVDPARIVFHDMAMHGSCCVLGSHSLAVFVLMGDESI